MTDHAPRPRLVLHAGLGKTGSSALQKFLGEHTGALRAAGAVYLGQGFELPVAQSGGFAGVADLRRALNHARRDPDAFAMRFGDAIRARIADAPDARVFVASQNTLSTAAEVMAPAIAALTDDCDVQVVLYFRHQAAWLASAYAQWGVKHKGYPGAIREFDAFRATMARTLDYRRTIGEWQAAVGASRVAVRSYDRADDVIGDFIAVAGLDVVPPASSRYYATPDPTLLALFKLHHGQTDAPALPGALLQLMSDGRLEDKRYRVVDPVFRLPEGAAWDTLVASFEAENQALAADFGLDLDPPAPREPTPDPAPAPATLIPALLDLILTLDGRVRALERRVAGYQQDSG